MKKVLNMAEAEKKKFNPVAFYKEVRSEMKKVTWPTRQETTVSTISVFIMVAIAAVFLYAADQIIAWAVSWIMNLGM